MENHDKTGKIAIKHNGVTCLKCDVVDEVYSIVEYSFNDYITEKLKVARLAKSMI